MSNEQLLTEGDIIKLEKGHNVYVDLPKHCFYSNKVGCFEIAHENIEVGSKPLGFDTAFLEGKYIVVKTVCDGGGTAHGPHDVFPNGHHVYCEKMVDSLDYKIKVDFYQTGSFTAMIEHIKPIGKGELTYKEIK